MVAAPVAPASVGPNVNPLGTVHAVPPAYAEASVGAIVLPVELRPNESDVTSPVATF